MDPNIQVTLEVIRDDQLGIIVGSCSDCIADFIFLLQERRFISGFLHPRNLLIIMLHLQLWRVNQTAVNGFSKEIHFMGGSNSQAFSGSKGNVSSFVKICKFVCY